MIIKKLAKLCREYGCLAFAYNDDQMWAGIEGRCMYWLSGIEIMGVDSLECVFDWTEKQKKKVSAIEVNYSDFAEKTEDKQFPALPRTAHIAGEDHRIYKYGTELYFIPEAWLEPIRDKLESGECEAFLRVRRDTAPAVVIKRGFIDIAVFEPEPVSEQIIRAWIKEYQGLITDIETAFGERYAQMSEQALLEGGDQMEMTADGAL